MKKIVDNLTGLQGSLLTYAHDEIATHFAYYEVSIVENLEECHPELTTMSSADLETNVFGAGQNFDKLESVYKQLLALRDMLKTNEDVDWSVEDANWEFQELSKKLEQILGGE